MDINVNNTEKINLEQLLGKLKTEDANYARISRSFQIMYWVFVSLYVIITIIFLIEREDVNRLIGSVCNIIAFLIFAIFFGKFYKEYKYVDYSLPTIKMLKNAVFRYKPFQLRTIWILIALVFMDAGLSLNSFEHFPSLYFQLFFIGTMILAIIIGLIIWYFKYKPLRDNALYLISEIEKE